MNKWKAVKFMLLSTLAFAVMNSFAKSLEAFHPFEIVFFRSLGSFVLCMFLLLKNRIPVLGNQRPLLALRGLTGLIAMALFFFSIQEMPFGSAISLRYLSPIFATIFGIFLLKEKVYNFQFIFFAIALAGVIMIKGFDIRVETKGLIYILTSAFFSGLVYIIIRKIGTGDHPLVVVNYFMFTTTLVGGIVTFFYWKSPQGIEWLTFLSLGIFGFFGQYYMTKAFQIEKASIVAPIKYVEVIYAMIIGFLWFGEGYTFLGFLGILLVILGMFLNIMIRPKAKAK